MFKALTETVEEVSLAQPKTEFIEIPKEHIQPISNQVPAATIVVGETSVEVYNSIQPELLQTILKGLKSC